MATPVVRTFDLYNTTFFWKGYTGVPGLSSELSVAKAYYIAQYSANPTGSLIDFFTELANGISQNPSFVINTANTDPLITVSTLPYLWARFWWEEAMFYTLNLVASALMLTQPNVYQFISESVGSLYWTSRANNLQNTNTVPYNLVIDRLLLPGISSIIQSFYQTANTLYNTNIAAIGPTGTDTAPNNSNLIMADTDLGRMINGTLGLTAAINNLYPAISSFLSFNTLVIGNLLTPYYWTTQMVYEPPLNVINVDLSNHSIGNATQLTTSTLIYTP